MERWQLAQVLSTSPRVRYLLLLTTTPHNGYSDSFASLLHMLDVGAVEGPEHAPFIHREIARKHVCQRTRRDLRRTVSRVATRLMPSPLDAVGPGPLETSGSASGAQLVS